MRPVHNIRPPARRQSELVVVANRLPVTLDRAADGRPIWVPSPGGLVTALEPLLSRYRGVWIGWLGAATPTASKTPDAADIDAIESRPEDDRTAGDASTEFPLYSVPLTAEEIRDYYEGFANTTLWPLYHDVTMPPLFDRDWWESYSRVNRKFAQVAAELAAPGAVVWIHDYQLQLVPAMLRALRPDLRIGFFLHIPFPPAGLFNRLPWREEIFSGVLGADLIGFQTHNDATNFVTLAGDLAGLTVEHEADPVTVDRAVIRLADRDSTVTAFPVSVDANRWDSLVRSPAVRARAAEIRSDLGMPRKILLGVDRLDYTKGIDLRLRAYRELLAEGRFDPAEVTMLQIATPSRERVAHYRQLRTQVEQIVGQINGEFGAVGRPAVHYLHTSVDLGELGALYTAADVMLVTPVRDGMNLVCKEFVASRHDDSGTLVLSEFAGAAAELTAALQFNPHSADAFKDIVVQALELDPEQARQRMRELRATVRNRDVHHWSRSFMATLEAITAARPILALRK